MTVVRERLGTRQDRPEQRQRDLKDGDVTAFAGGKKAAPETRLRNRNRASPKEAIGSSSLQCDHLHPNAF